MLERGKVTLELHRLARPKRTLPYNLLRMAAEAVTAFLALSLIEAFADCSDSATP